MSTLLEQAELAADLLGAAAHENGRIVCTAESLTGGMVSELITSVAGSLLKPWRAVHSPAAMRICLSPLRGLQGRPAALRKRRSARFVLGGQNAILPERSQQVCVPFTSPVIAEQCGWPLL